MNNFTYGLLVPDLMQVIHVRHKKKKYFFRIRISSDTNYNHNY